MDIENRKVCFDYIGRTDFSECFDLQTNIREAVLENRTPQTVILTEHNKVFTLGRREDGKNLLLSKDFLEKNGFSVVKTTRGGMITYHGPGQLVIYPILDLKRLHLKVKEYVKNLELTVIDTLSTLGIDAQRKEGYQGVWVGDKKIGSLGIHVKRSVTMHGFALNVSTDLKDFSYINPCGFQSLELTSIVKESKNDITLESLSLMIMKSFGKVFSVEIEKINIDDSLSIKSKTSFKQI